MTFASSSNKAFHPQHVVHNIIAYPNTNVLIGSPDLGQQHDLIMAETRLGLDSTALSKFFQSPQTPPSTLKSRPTTATSHVDSSYVLTNGRPSISNRKRSRDECYGKESPYTSAISPPPLTNMQYRLAGGLDTPTAISSQYSVHDTATPDVAFRRGRPYISRERNDYYFHEAGRNSIGGIPGKDGNGRAPRPANKPSSQTSWGSLISGLAGKVFEFCTAGTFQGFFSGGGQGYTIEVAHASSPITSPKHQFNEYEWLDMPTSISPEVDSDDFRVTKKSKAGHDNTWVVIQSPSKSLHKAKPSFIPRPSSPAVFRNDGLIKQATNASTVTIGRTLKRPIGNLQRNTSSRMASLAGLRSANSAPDVSQPRSGHRHCRNSSVKSTPYSLNLGQDSYATKPMSNKSTKTQASRTSGSPSPHHVVQTREQAESPLAKETRKHLDNVRKRELAEDIEIMRMNRHLKNLINQGKEALGTRVEVDFGEDEDHW